MRNASSERSLIEEFGMPDYKVNPYGEGKTYAEGVRCDLNLGCAFVNTLKCNILKCQRPSVQMSKGLDGAID